MRVASPTYNPPSVSEGRATARSVLYRGLDRLHAVKPYPNPPSDSEHRAECVLCTVQGFGNSGKEFNKILKELTIPYLGEKVSER